MSYVTEWGRKAADLYATDYARRYREHDEELSQVEAYRAFCEWLRDICGRFRRSIDVLDLGCGTGRYFAALRNVNALVGLDASGPMLAEAANPVGAEQITAKTIQLIEGDALTHQFSPDSFDLIYSVGVLAEHTPFDSRIVDNVATWLRPGGRFAFTPTFPLVSLVLGVHSGGECEQQHDDCWPNPPLETRFTSPNIDHWNSPRLPHWTSETLPSRNVIFRSR